MHIHMYTYMNIYQNACAYIILHIIRYVYNYCRLNIFAWDNGIGLRRRTQAIQGEGPRGLSSREESKHWRPLYIMDNRALIF